MPESFRLCNVPALKGAFMKLKNLLARLLVGIICLPFMSFGEDVVALRQKAEQGDVAAQCTLGNVYQCGNDVPKDYKESIKWYRLAAEQGDANAQYSLASMYYQGEGVPQDYKEAAKWSRLAAEQGLEWEGAKGKAKVAQRLLADCYVKIGGALPYYNNENQKWYQAAAELCIPLAEKGDVWAQDTLGELYFRGTLGGQGHYQEALKWLRLAAEQGSFRSLYTLCLYKELGLDDNERIKWTRLAAEEGYAFGQNNLGAFYFSAKDYEEGVKWFLLAAQQGYVDAQIALGNFYYLGNGVPQDYAQAFAWLSMAADQGNQEAVKFYSDLLKVMTPEQIAEGQRLAREYAAKFVK